MKIKIKQKKMIYEIELNSEQNLLEVLQKNKISLPALCNGNGTCGKCKVKVLNETVSVTKADRIVFDEEELSRGKRLACKVNIEELKAKDRTEPVIFEIEGEAEEEIVVTKPVVAIKEESIQKTQYFIAVDIGTTTIVVALVEKRTGEVREVYSCLNHQRKYGADVLSRIASANDGKGEELKRLAEEDLWKGIGEVLRKTTDKEKVEKIVIAGNTTMIHLLMGYSCETLGKYPFVSEWLEQYDGSLKECLRISQNTELQDILVTVLPGISVFVGADIVAGINGIEAFESDEISLFVDLGTNGEMVLGTKDRIVVASAAAGPAFEGGNIICGCASIPGAISRIKIQNKRAVIKSIGDILPPKGICGTGLVSAVAQLKIHNMMNKEGTMIFPYDRQGFSLWSGTEEGKIALYQSDLREFQMAKAAIRTGIEIMMEKYGCKPEEIGRVYLAGGFGTQLPEADAIETGIFPVEFQGKVTNVGNAVLNGIIRGEIQGRTMNLREKKIESISLAQTEGFYERYVANINF